MKNPIHSAFCTVFALASIGILMEGHLFMTRGFCIGFAVFTWFMGVLTSARIREWGRTYLKDTSEPKATETDRREEAKDDLS